MDTLVDFRIDIGRNVGSKPMPADKWRGFQAAVRIIAGQAHADIVGCCSGTSTYSGGPDGPETEQTFGLFGSVIDSKLSWIESCLSDLASVYGQWGIALTVGKVTIVERTA